MPLFFIVIGAAMFTAGFRGKSDDLAALVANEFKGDGDIPGFATWAAAVIAVASVGYVKEARSFSNALLVLVFASMILSKAGQITKGEQAIDNVVNLVTNKGTKT